MKCGECGKETDNPIGLCYDCMDECLEELGFGNKEK
jgi:hypothetical protein